jgi:hypothetical protein
VKEFLLVLCVLVVLLGGGCATAPSCAGNHLHYGYAAQVLAMPSCNATMELVSPCERRFRTKSGRVFTIGDPGAEQDVASFLGTLDEGKSYYLPYEFVEYLKEKKEKAEQSPRGDSLKAAPQE